MYIYKLINCTTPFDFGKTQKKRYKQGDTFIAKDACEMKEFIMTFYATNEGAGTTELSKGVLEKLNKECPGTSHNKQPKTLSLSNQSEPDRKKKTGIKNQQSVSGIQKKGVPKGQIRIQETKNGGDLLHKNLRKGINVYQLQNGESLQSLEQQWGMTNGTLRQLNPNLNNSNLSPGHPIVMPPVIITTAPPLRSKGGGFSDPHRWDRAIDSTLHGVFGSGAYQIGSFPISRFNGISLPPGSRIQFADIGRALSKTKMETRLMSISALTQKGNNGYYAWDAHLPKGTKPHNYWHINQEGTYYLFNQSDHSKLTPAQISQAKTLRYLKHGTRALFVIGIASDTIDMASSVKESVEKGTPKPVIAQTIRTAGGWGGAWAGAKILCAAGGAVTIETGPGAILGCIAGGMIGGAAGYYGADWIADSIHED